MSQTLDDGKLSILETAGSRGISAKQLDGMLTRHVAPDVQILLVFAQCYGGNMARSKYMEERANTCVLSGTDHGQEAGYAGYHDDAARSLKPGEGRTAADVHKGGVAGIRALYPDDTNEARVWNEEPIVTGALKPEQFSLDPVADSGAVIARQVVIYSAKPEVEHINIRMHDDASIPMPGKGNEIQVGDLIDRDQIVKNFAGESNTDLRTVGGEANPVNPGSGVKGWSAPGTEASLEFAIKAAGATLKQTSGDGARQLIMYVGDHGVGTRRDEFDQPITVSAQSSATLLEGITPFESESAFVVSLNRSKDAVPGFELIIDVPEGFDPTSGVAFPIADDALSLTVGPATAERFEWTYEPAVDTDGDTIRLVFPVARKAFFTMLETEQLSAEFENRSETSLVVHGFVQTTGAIGRSMGPLRGILPTLLGGWFWHTKA